MHAIEKAITPLFADWVIYICEFIVELTIGQYCVAMLLSITAACVQKIQYVRVC